MTLLISALRDKLMVDGVSPVSIIDSPDKGTAVLLTPYSSYSIGDTKLGAQQIQVRAADITYPLAEDLAWRCYNSLKNAALTAFDREQIGLVTTDREPYFLGKDDSGRYIETFNVTVYAVEKGV